MQIRILKSIAGRNFSYRRGAVVDWKDDKEAERLIEAGAARKLSKAEQAYEDELEKDKTAKAEAEAKADAATAKAVADTKKKRADAAKKTDAAKAKTQRRAPGRPPGKKAPAKKAPAK
jgi:hypothetical protein